MYREWQNEFSKMMEVPYPYLKEVGDACFDLLYRDSANELFEKELKNDNYNRQNW